MNRLRVFSTVIFVISVIVFGTFMIRQRMEHDTGVPVITLSDDRIEVSVTDNEEALLQGVTAMDAADGDVTRTIVVENISNFYEKGKRLVNYVAFDSDMNSSKASRELIYTDYVSPRFSLSAPLHFRIGTKDIMGDIHAFDVLDGDISRKIKMIPEEGFDSSQAGSYSAELEVSNSAGDVSRLPVRVEFYESMESGPDIMLSEYLVYTDVGKKINAEDYLQSVYLDGARYYFPNANLSTEQREALAQADAEQYGVEAVAEAEAVQPEEPEEETAEETETEEGTESGAEEEEVDIKAIEQEAEARLTSMGGEIGYDQVKIQNAVNYQEPGVYRIYYTMTDRWDNSSTVQLLVAVGMD